MNKKLVIKSFKLRKKSKHNISRIIVVGYNYSKVNGGYIEKLGSYGTIYNTVNRSLKTDIICSIDLRRLGYWLNKGAKIKNRISWLIGLLSYNDTK